MKLLKRLIAFFLIMLLFYLLGSFIALSFDISNWALEGRMAYAISGTAFAAGVSFLISKE